MYPEDNSDFFHGLFENRSSKVAAIIFSFIGSCSITLLTLYIDWYNKYSKDAKHTVASKLYSYAWLWALAWILTAQQVDMVRYIFGPLPRSVCQFSLLVKCCITIQGIMVLECSAIWRYLLIFWIKNPTGVKDGFWITFLNVWIFMFTIITEGVYVYWPSKLGADIHICSGTDPSSDKDLPENKFLLNQTIKFFIVPLYTVILTRIHIYKWKMSRDNKVKLPFALI